MQAQHAQFCGWWSSGRHRIARDVHLRFTRDTASKKPNRQRSNVPRRVMLIVPISGLLSVLKLIVRIIISQRRACVIPGMSTTCKQIAILISRCNTLGWFRLHVPRPAESGLLLQNVCTISSLWEQCIDTGAAQTLCVQLRGRCKISCDVTYACPEYQRHCDKMYEREENSTRQADDAHPSTAPPKILSVQHFHTY